MTLSPRGRQVVFALLVGLAAFLVYFRTLAVSIAWGDSPELTTAAFNAGVPHPTGYPLYMLLSHTFLRCLPFGSIAFRMNLLSALSASFAVCLIFLLMGRVTRSRLAGLVGTLVIAFSQTFWSQAVIAEVYAFHMLGMAAVLGCVLAWDRRGERRWLWVSAVVYGLCFTHHMMSVLLAPGLLYFALTSPHRRQFVRELRWTLPLFILPLCLYAYLPLAALRDTPSDWGDPRTWDRFLAHVTGRQYRPAMFHLTRVQLWRQLGRYAGFGTGTGSGFLAAQFPGFLWLAPIGAWSLARRRRLFALTLLIYLVDVAYALNYYIFDVDVYYLPSHLMVAIWIACGVRQAGGWLGLLWRRIALPPAKRRPLNRLLAPSLLVLPLMLLTTNWEANDHHVDWSVLMYARAALATLKPNAVLISGDDETYFPLLYTRFVERRRPDVTLLCVYDTMRSDCLRVTTRLARQGLVVRVPPDFGRLPSLPDDNRLLKRLVADNVRRRPVYLLTGPKARQLPWLKEAIAPYRQVAASNVPSIELTLHPPLLWAEHSHLTKGDPIRFGSLKPTGSRESAVELLGYDVAPLPGGGVPAFRISYVWRVNDPATAVAAKVWVLFTNAAGNYRKKEDGSPEFHNIHPLGYGHLRGSQPVPRTLEETYTLYVPPGEWSDRLHVRVAVAIGERFLACGPRGSQWAELGALPSVSQLSRPRGFQTVAALRQ